MRLSLRWKVTIAMVAFGLIPAGIVAAFAYKSTDDFMAKQNRIISTSAAAVADQIATLFLKKLETAAVVEKMVKDTPNRPLKLDLNDDDRSTIRTIVADAMRLYSLPTAAVWVVDGEDHVIFKRRNDGSPDVKTSLDDKYIDTARQAMGKVGTDAIPARSEPLYEPAEIVGYAPVRLGPELSPKFMGHNQHGHVVLVVMSRAIAYETIYTNQNWTLAILAASFFLTLLLGILFGQWFMRPLLKIKDVTEDLHEGHLFNRTHIERKDELGDLASLTNSVVDRLAEVISQIRSMTSSVTTASSELNSTSTTRTGRISRRRRYKK